MLNDTSPHHCRIHCINVINFIKSIYTFNNFESSIRYGWRLYQKQWTKCNSICEGKQFRKPICVDLVSGTEVSKNYCLNLEGMPTQKQECNTHCQLTWNIDSRSSCKPSCGKG